MQELTPETITAAVLEQMATTPDARLKEIMAAAVKHLHAFAREVDLKPDEWIKGIEFMTQVGQMCTPERQEFILLSDTMGLSALVNGLHDKTAIEEGTHTSLLGPFYREATPTLAPGSQIAKKVKPGSECVLFGRITDVNGKPLAGATVSVWQTSADGLYDIQESATEISEGSAKSDVALTPLAMPMLAGPGAISTVMVLSGQAGSTTERLAVYLAVVVTMALSWIALRLGERVVVRPGRNGDSR